MTESNSSAKELLLQDFRHIADALWKSEQAGETRVNWFIGIVTAVAGGLVSLTTAKDGPDGKSLQLIVIASLAGLFVFGIITLARIIIRNQTTDGLKRALDDIRQIFRQGSDDQGKLFDYYPFGRSRRTHRKFGGLAHIVIGINSLVASGLAGVARLPCSYLSKSLGPKVGDLVPTYWAAGIAFFASAAVQGGYLYWREQKKKKKSTITLPNRVGGVVYKTDKSGAVHYLLVGPKDGPPSEWLLPKGHPEEHEANAETAVREVREETGIVARPIAPVGMVQFEKNGESINVEYYLMEAIEETDPSEARCSRWFPFDRALQQLTYEQTKHLLLQAERRRLAQSRRTRQ